MSVSGEKKKVKVTLEANVGVGMKFTKMKPGDSPPKVTVGGMTMTSYEKHVNGELVKKGPSLKVEGCTLSEGDSITEKMEFELEPEEYFSQE